VVYGILSFYYLKILCNLGNVVTHAYSWDYGINKIVIFWYG
jgi:hypothetical protein